MNTWLWIAIVVVAPPAVAQPTLNEIMADPASDWSGDGEFSSRGDEWVEIANLGGTSISLDGYRLASADTTWRYEFSGVLSPQSAVVVTGDQSVEWERETGNPAFGLRLSNTGGEIHLWRVTETDTTWIESASYTDEAAEDDRSWGRQADGGTEWVLFDGLNPYKGDPPPTSTGCDPTPNGTNECIVPVQDSTWSDIKALYGWRRAEVSGGA